MPFFGRSVWFASAYISLIALVPYLNRIFELPRPSLTRLVILLFVFFCIVSTVPQFTPCEYLADFAWFPVVYLLVGWAKRDHLFDRLGSPALNLLLALGLYGGLCALRLSVAAPLANYWMGNIRSLPSLAFAVLLFNAFRQMNLGRVRIINLLARSTFAVYIVHQIPAFEKFEWSVFHPEVISRLGEQTAALIAVAVAVFLAVMLLDSIRLAFIEPKILFLNPVKRLIARIADWYGVDG